MYYRDMSRRQSHLAAALVATAVTAVPVFDAHGEGAKFPNRPIQLIMPYAAGGAVDQTARFLQQGLWHP